MNKDVKILGVSITNATFKEVLEYLLENAEKSTKKIFVTTLNPEILTHSVKDPDYKVVLNSSDLALPDGVGVLIAARLLGKSIKQRISGTDLMEKLCEEASIRPITVGLFGGRPKVAEDAADRLKKRFPGLKISFAISRWPDFEAKSDPLVCDILFVALGYPKQEAWIFDHLKKIDAKIAMGVGGAFDYLSERVPRAPKIVRDLGFEWLFRLVRQPWRVRRQLNLIYFVLLILKEKFKS